jgi:hypothetical protein
MEDADGTVCERCQKAGCACMWDGPGHACDFCKQRKIACDLSGWVKRWRVVPEDSLEVEMPKKRARTEIPGVCRPSVVIETTPVERLLRELLACNSRVARAAEEKWRSFVRSRRNSMGLGPSGPSTWNGMERRNRKGRQDWEGADENGNGVKVLSRLSV